MSALDSGELPDVDRKAAVDLVLEMMAVPGKSGDEAQVAALIRRKLRAAGIKKTAVVEDRVPRKSPLNGECGNLIVKVPGTVRGPRRLLMAHIDTVPLCVGSRPVRRGNVITSRDPHTALGADDRAGASVILNAILEIRRQRLPHPPLTLFWPVQEEIGLYGVRYASIGKLGRPNLCFNWDGGSAYHVTIGATGDYNMEIEIDGIASHAGARPEQGVSAIAVAGLAIADLVSNGWHGLVIKGANVGTSNIGYVNAGEATNVVTPHLTLHAEVRSHDPRFRERLLKEFRRAFEKAAQAVKNDEGRPAGVRFSSELRYESFRLSEKQPCVKTAISAVQAIGLDPIVQIANGGLDANWLSARGLPTVTLGCGQRHAHTVNEELHVDDYLNACRLGLLLATGHT